jgi:hypothetical protein
MKLTPWFPANVKPVRVGVYEVRMKAPWYRYWDGVHWHAGHCTSELACALPHLPIENTPPEPWRGLAEEPK